MSTIIIEYLNKRNGGQERVKREGENYFIDSDFGMGFSGWKMVSKKDMEDVLSWTKAPKIVKSEILC